MLEWFRRVSNRVDDIDSALVRRSSQLPPSPADRSLKLLSSSANRSALWLVIAAALATRKGATRRASFRGVAAIAGASAVTNLLGKPLFPRRRPAAHLVPSHRRLADPPTSSSFPSGHAASATAFATAVAMESPSAGAALAPLAAAIAYSRVHMGVHWASDVLCGAAVGAGMATTTRRWWPLRRAEPPRPGHAVAAPAMPDGQDMLVVINPEAGGASPATEARLTAAWPGATLLRIGPQTDVGATLDEMLDTEHSFVRALGVAGGDGTVGAVASVAARHALPLAVLPAGTLNHFARDSGSEVPGEVFAAVGRGDAAALSLSAVVIDGRAPRWFVNTANLGGYPDMVRLREQWAARWGRWPAGAAAVVRVLHESTPLELEIDGERRRVWLFFVGNGTYEPRGFAPGWRLRLDNGLLDVRYVRADRRFSRLRFALSALTGTLHRSQTYVQRDCSQLSVAVRGAPVCLATDGEVGPEGRRFEFSAHHDALTVYRPST